MAGYLDQVGTGEWQENNEVNSPRVRLRGNNVGPWASGYGAQPDNIQLPESTFTANANETPNDAAARYGPTGPTPTRSMPSPEAILSGGQMNAGGSISAPTMPTSPTPVSSMPPVPNPLPSPSPRAMTALRGSMGGLQGGGLGLAGKAGIDEAQASPLIALLSMLGG